MWKIAATTAKTFLLLFGGALLQYGLADSVSQAYSFSSLAVGPRLLAEHVLIFLGGFVPALIMNGALIGLFRPRSAARVALPVSTGLMLVCWAFWLWSVFALKYPDISIAGLRWSLIVAAPLGIVSASALFVLVSTKAQRPASWLA